VAAHSSMPRERAPSPPKRVYTFASSKEELVALHQQVGRLQAQCVVTSATDVVLPLLSSATDAVRLYIDKVQHMEGLEDEEQERSRRGQVGVAEGLLAQISACRRAAVAAGEGHCAAAPLPSGGTGQPPPALRVGRGAVARSPHRGHSRELISAAGVVALLSQASSGGRGGEVSLGGKRLVHSGAGGGDGLEVVEALAAAVRSHVSGLHSLLLPGCGLGDEAVVILAPALALHPSLTRLDLSDNELGPAGAAALVEAAFSDADDEDRRGLSSAAGSRGRGGGGGGSSVSGGGRLGTGACRGIEWLELGDNRLGADGARSIGKALSWGGCRIQHLGMRANALKLAGVSFGLERHGGGGGGGGLSAAGSLTTLDLARNGLGDEGASRLSQALCGSVGRLSLRKLDLAVNGIGWVGVEAIQRAMLALAQARATSGAEPAVDGADTARAEHEQEKEGGQEPAVVQPLEVVELRGNPLGARGVGVLADAVAAVVRLQAGGHIGGMQQLQLQNCAEVAQPTRAGAAEQQLSPEAEAEAEDENDDGSRLDDDDDDDDDGSGSSFWARLGCEELARHLRVLELQGCGLGDAALARHLCPAWVKHGQPLVRADTTDTGSHLGLTDGLLRRLCLRLRLWPSCV
jgi:hypothetical protein